MENETTKDFLRKVQDLFLGTVLLADAELNFLFDPSLSLSTQALLYIAYLFEQMLPNNKQQLLSINYPSYGNNMTTGGFVRLLIPDREFQAMGLLHHSLILELPRTGKGMSWSFVHFKNSDDLFRCDEETLRPNSMLMPNSRKGVLMLVNIFKKAGYQVRVGVYNLVTTIELSSENFHIRLNLIFNMDPDEAKGLAFFSEDSIITEIPLTDS